LVGGQTRGPSDPHRGQALRARTLWPWITDAYRKQPAPELIVASPDIQYWDNPAWWRARRESKGT